MGIYKKLIAHWSMEGKEASGGKIYDRSGYKNHGTMNNITIDSSDNKTDFDSFNFDQSEAYIKTPTGFLSDNTSKTWGFWVKYSGNSSGDVYNFESDISHALNIGRNGGSNLHLFISGSWNDSGISMGTSWKHVTVTYDSGTDNWNVYIDGSQQYSTTQNLQSSNKEQSRIGTSITKQITENRLYSFGFSELQGGKPFKDTKTVSSRLIEARVDDFRIFDRVLSDRDITTLYNQFSSINSEIRSSF